MENGVMEIKFNEVVKGDVKREDILAFENILARVPGASYGDNPDMPLKHSFAEGVYVREIFIPKGSVLTGKIHRHSHPNFLMKGEVLVVTEDGGREHLKAPLSMISKAGTKRVIYTVEDTVWITVHVTNETDLEKIEEFVIAKTFDDLQLDGPINPNPVAIQMELEAKNCLILALKEKGRDYKCLLHLKADGHLLPLNLARKTLKDSGVATDGIFISEKNIQGTLHATTEGGIPFDEYVCSDNEMVGTWAAVAIGGASLVGTVGSQAGWFGDGGKVTQKPLKTAQQTAAEVDLSTFGRTGKTPWGYDFTKGYEGSLGNYDMTDLERSGSASLSSMMGMGNPAIFGLGTGELTKLLGTNAYDPNNDGGVYSGLTAGIDRNIQLAIDATKRGASYMGNLYSTNAARSIGDVAAQGGINKSNILAQLYQNFTNQKLAGAQAAIGAGGQEQGMDLARIGAAYQYGNLPRALEDTKAKDSYNAWLTQRNSQLAPLSAHAQVLGANPNFGVESVPIESPWAKLLNTAATTGAYIYGSNQGNKSQTLDMNQWQNQYQWG